MSFVMANLPAMTPDGFCSGTITFAGKAPFKFKKPKVTQVNGVEVKKTHGESFALRVNVQGTQTDIPMTVWLADNVNILGQVDKDTGKKKYNKLVKLFLVTGMLDVASISDVTAENLVEKQAEFQANVLPELWDKFEGLKGQNIRFKMAERDAGSLGQIDLTTIELV